MKEIKKETVEYIFDTDLINEVVYYIEHGYRGRLDDGKADSREVISRIVNDANEILSTLKKQPITIDINYKENESDAIKYFGNDFIKQFEEIRKTNNRKSYIYK